MPFTGPRENHSIRARSQSRLITSARERSVVALILPTRCGAVREWRRGRTKKKDCSHLTCSAVPAVCLVLPTTRRTNSFEWKRSDCYLESPRCSRGPFSPDPDVEEVTLEKEFVEVHYGAAGGKNGSRDFSLLCSQRNYFMYMYFSIDSFLATILGPPIVN